MIESHFHNLASHSDKIASQSHKLAIHSHKIASHSHKFASHSHKKASHSHTLASHSYKIASRFYMLASCSHKIASHSHNLTSHSHKLASHSQFNWKLYERYLENKIQDRSVAHSSVSAMSHSSPKRSHVCGTHCSVSHRYGASRSIKHHSSSGDSDEDNIIHNGC